MSQDGCSKRGCVLLNKRKLVNLAQKIACAAGAILLSFLCILPTFASDYPNYPDIDLSGVTYDVGEYPYLTFDLATNTNIYAIDTKLVIDERTMLTSGQTDFILAIDGGIEFVFTSSGTDYIVNAGQASYRIKRTMRDDGYCYVTMDLVFSRCKLHVVSGGEWIYMGDREALYTSFGLMKYLPDPDTGYPIISDTQAYYEGLDVEGHWFDGGTVWFCDYALTTLRTEAETFNQLTFARLNMYLPFGSDTGRFQTSQSTYTYGLGGICMMAGLDMHGELEYYGYDRAITPLIGQRLVEYVSNTRYSEGREEGYNAGIATADLGNVGSLMSGIFEGIYDVFNAILDFNIPIGNSVINFAQIAGMLIALVLIIIVVRFILR